jgi:pimeloyl-ACP methyl ester carboxylesterase
LIGHSWGGTIVLKAGHEVPCVRVIAIDPMIHYASGQWASDFVDDLQPVFAVLGNAREGVIRAMFDGLPPVEVNAKVHALRNMTIEPVVALGAENGADAGKWDLREVVRGYPKPLLLLLADPSDSVVSPEDAAFVREAGGANVMVEVFEGEGHTLHRTAFDRFAASVSAFLTST